MAKPNKRRKPKIKAAGLPPGSVVFTGNQKVEKVLVHYLNYSEEHLLDKDFHTHEGIICPPSSEKSVDWYDVRGLHDTSVIEFFGQTFDIHPLILEDVADVDQRAKYEEYRNGIFIILRALSFDKTILEVKTEQVAIYFKKGLLISFQEDETDLFGAVRQRLQAGRGRIRKRDSDYLAYALMDNIVDSYYTVLDEVEDVIELLEDEIITQPDNSIKGQIHHLKKELLLIRKSIAPLREAIGQFAKSDHSQISEGTDIYIRDVYDHTVQVMDMVETYRDMLNGLQDLYLSEISFKMNQVMQVLAVVTTLFVPISFLAGLYGMNFDHMPELHTENGYFVLLGVMVIIVIGLLGYFKVKRWF